MRRGSDRLVLGIAAVAIGAVVLGAVLFASFELYGPCIIEIRNATGSPIRFAAVVGDDDFGTRKLASDSHTYIFFAPGTDGHLSIACAKASQAMGDPAQEGYFTGSLPEWVRVTLKHCDPIDLDYDESDY
jgi:hypothetical protein